MLGFISGCSPVWDTTEHFLRQADKMAAHQRKSSDLASEKKLLGAL